MSDFDFKQDLKLDRCDLEAICEEDPVTYANWGLLWADAVRDRDTLKDKLALVRSQCDQEIRETPSEFGWQKIDKAPTEAFISSAIVSHVNYVEANEEYHEAAYRVNVLQVAKESFDRRDRRISNLVSLVNGGYYSGNRSLAQGPRYDASEAMEKAQTDALERSPRLQRRTTGGGNDKS
jgi:hypothetical protein